jgi:hypothetical protein
MSVVIYKVNASAIPRTVSADFDVDLGAWEQREVLRYEEDSMVECFKRMYDSLGGWDKSYMDVKLILQTRAIVSCVNNQTERAKLLAMVNGTDKEEILYACIQ